MAQVRASCSHLKPLDAARTQWTSAEHHTNEKRTRRSFFLSPWNSVEAHGAIFGAGNETRTRDPDLGKVVLYQLSYSRVLVWRIV